MPYQSEFSAALLDPAQPTPRGLVGPGGAPAGRRYDVYRNTVTASLIDALRTGFPVVEKLVGATNFGILALGYVRQHPPRSPMLMFYGEDFDDYIAKFERLAHAPYLPDIARLELARRRSYHALDVPIFDAKAMQTLGETGLMAHKLRAAPATIMLRSPYPIYDIWMRNSHENNHPISGDGQNVLITRPGLDVMVTDVPPQIADFLATLNAQNFGAAVETMLRDNPNFALGDALTLILQTGFAQFTE